MALVTQTELLTASYVPYERPPQPQTLWTAIPRGLTSFQFSGQLDAKGIGDSALLKIVGILPANFGFVMNDLHWNIDVDVAADWNAKTSLKLRTFYRGETAVGLTGYWGHGTTVVVKNNTVRSLVASSNTEPWPSFPLVSDPGSPGIQWDFQAWNGDTVNAGAIGVLNFWISFWQFDLEQIRKYPINSPLPTHAR